MLPLVSALFALLLPAGAATVIYSDRTSFLNQAVAWTVIDFDTTIGPNAFVNYSDAAGLTEAGVHFVSYRSFPNALTYNLMAGDSMTCCGVSVDGSAALYLAWSQASIGAQGVTDISLPSGVTAFGFDLINNQVSAAYPYQITLSDGSIFQGMADRTPQFYGFVSDAPISHLRIEMPLPPGSGDQASRLAIDNVVFASSVPEPSTGAGAAAGMLLCALLGKRSGSRDHRRR
ncbi:MAG: hypothetical protein JNK87_27315 [Bryobacterales bacterium]|nr:hypothetical protein [Bryobacterales bacterium]